MIKKPSLSPVRQYGLQDETILRHIASGRLVKIGEKTQESPAPKKKKSDPVVAEEVVAPEIIEEVSTPVEPVIEDSILDGDSE